MLYRLKSSDSLGASIVNFNYLIWLEHETKDPKYRDPMLYWWNKMTMQARLKKLGLDQLKMEIQYQQAQQFGENKIYSMGLLREIESLARAHV